MMKDKGIKMSKIDFLWISCLEKCTSPVFNYGQKH